MSTNCAAMMVAAAVMAMVVSVSRHILLAPEMYLSEGDVYSIMCLLRDGTFPIILFNVPVRNPTEDSSHVV